MELLRIQALAVNTVFVAGGSAGFNVTTGTAAQAHSMPRGTP
jgi:hypothetical protein